MRVLIKSQGQLCYVGKLDAPSRVMETRQVTRAIHLVYVYPEIKSYEFSNGKALQNNSSLLIFTHTINA